MAEYKDSRGIRCFTPDDSPTVLHIQSSFSTLSLEEILERARDHFGADVDLSTLTIEAEHIHTRCLGFDQYDGGDWDDFIVITKIG
jgi:hypothetical protein